MRPPPSPQYTCKAYREEMLLLTLERRLCRPGLPETEKAAIQQEIDALKKKMKMD